MKRNILLIITLILVTTSAFAQERRKSNSFIFFPHINTSPVTMWNLPMKMSGPSGEIDIKRRKWNLLFWTDEDSKFDYGDFYAGVKMIYVNPLSVVGGFAYLDYKNKGFDMRYPGAENFTRHYAQAVAPAVGLRLRTGRLTGFHWVVEAGTAYNFNFKYHGSYDNKLDVINNGFTGIYGVGFEFVSGRKDDLRQSTSTTSYQASYQGASKDAYFSLTLQYHRDHYNFFNEDFSPDGGATKPYQGFKSSIGYLCLTWTIRGSILWHNELRK